MSPGSADGIFVCVCVRLGRNALAITNAIKRCRSQMRNFPLNRRILVNVYIQQCTAHRHTQTFHFNNFQLLFRIWFITINANIAAPHAISHYYLCTLICLEFVSLSLSLIIILIWILYEQKNHRSIDRSTLMLPVYVCAIGFWYFEKDKWWIQTTKLWKGKCLCLATISIVVI